MEKEVRLLLNRFPKLPFSLSESGKGDSPRTSLEVNLANLFHHYWLDSYGVAPPNPDPVHFEHLQFLVNTEEFRIRGSGIGEPTHIRRNRSQELGHAFCRWFLAEHLQITYFAHMSRVLNKTDNFSGCSIVRTDAGDTPDYLCAESSKKVYLAEAKARYDSIGFDTAEFDDWRQQFQRVAVEDSDGQDRVVKGFIVATRLSTEAQPNVKTTLLCEDPETRGEGGLGVEDERALASKIVSLHYSDVAIKLNQQTLSASLIQGFLIPEGLRFPATVWEFVLPYSPLQNRRWVGGYYSKTGLPLPFRQIGDTVALNYYDPFRLDSGGGTFFGIEESIFQQITAIAREGISAAFDIDQFDYTEPFYSGVSVLRDGTMLAPIEFLRPVEQVQY